MAGAHVDYDRHGSTYAHHRRADRRIAAAIDEALGDARSVVNVGAGAGSYEPAGRSVVAVEPSATMRAQRPVGAAPAIAGRAEALPLADGAVDAAMACLTVHHWTPPAVGLAELRRVARGPVVVFTFDLDHLVAWQRDYLGEAVVIEQGRFPSTSAIAEALGGRTRVEAIPSPADCTDGWFEAFWARPEGLLDPAVRSAQSIWPLVGPEREARIVARLAADLASGRWDAHHGHVRAAEAYDGPLRLVVAEPG